MALLSDFLKRRLSKEEIEETTVDVEPGDEPGSVAVSSTTTEDKPVSAPVATASADESIPQEPAVVEPAATETEPKEEDLIDSKLEEVRAEVEQTQSEQFDVAEAQDVSERLDDTVATMESLLDRGFVSTAEVKLNVNRAHALLRRLDIPVTQFATEALDSEEGRLETLALSKESFKEKAGQLKDAIVSGAKRIKDRVVAAAKAAVSVDERYNQLGHQLVSGADSLKGRAQIAPTVKIAGGRFKYLADGSSQAMDPAKVAATLLSFTKYLTGDYAKKVAGLKNGDEIPALKLPNGLPGAPTAEMRSGTHSAAILFELHYNGQPKDLSIKALSADEVKHVGQAMVEITDLLRGKWITDMLYGGGEEDNFNIRDQLASSLLEIAVYVRHVVAALYAAADKSSENFKDAE